MNKRQKNFIRFITLFMFLIATIQLLQYQSTVWGFMQFITGIPTLHSIWRFEQWLMMK